MRVSTRGFTLIELLLVVVIIGILASIAIPKFTNAREKAYLASVMSDLKALSTMQEVYQDDNQAYATDATDLIYFSASDGVNISVNETVAGTGWAATAWHDAVAGKICGVFYGNASASNATPATSPGVVACQS